MVMLDSDAALGILPGTTNQVDPSSAWPIAGDAGTASGSGSGLYGFTPDVGGGMGNALTSVWNWLNAPFKTPLSPVDITLLVGVILIAILLWNLILYHIRIAAEAL